jgi:hypothetical protein
LGRIKKKMELGEPVSPTKHHNCKDIRETTLWQDRMLKKLVLENCRRTTKDLTVMMSNAGAHISSRIVHRHLSKFGFKSPRPSENPKLTQATRKERLAQAHKCKSWTKDD